jgi:hypothetical protein
VSVSSSIGSMGVSANIRSLPQSAPIMLPQTTNYIWCGVCIWSKLDPICMGK